MELREEFKNGATVLHENIGHVKIINDPTQFKKYKKLGLDVFKVKEKKAKKEYKKED